MPLFRGERFDVSKENHCGFVFFFFGQAAERKLYPEPMRPCGEVRRLNVHCWATDERIQGSEGDTFIVKVLFFIPMCSFFHLLLVVV